MNRLQKFRLSLALLLSLIVFTVAPPAAFGESAEQLQEVRELLEKYHFSKPNHQDLNVNQIDGMVEALEDPYTEYFDEEEWKSFNSMLEQTFVGIGIVMTQQEGAITIEEVLGGSPAEAAGLLAGDELRSADGHSLAGKSLVEIQSEIKGVEGTTVSIGVARAGEDLLFRVERRSIQLPVVKSMMLGDGVGYLALSGFTSDAGAHINNHLMELENNGLTSLVLDLRNNGGGYLSAAQEIAGLFIKDGVLAHMRDRNGKDNPIVIRGGTKPYKLILLLNGNSASASELLAGALQDYQVAKLVGTQSYGKGVVQSLIPLKTGGMLKITIQEYYTPTGRKVNKVGLKPDMLLEGSIQQFIGAYYLAGGQALNLNSDLSSVTINGVKMSSQGLIFREANGWHINMRLAALMLGADLTYDAKEKAITVSRGSQVHTIKTNDMHIKMINGMSNIHMGILKRWFSDVTYSVTGDRSTLEVSAR